MTKLSVRALGLGAAALLLHAAPAAPAAAQSTFGAFTEEPSAALARHLRALVANPRNLDALRGAGRAALEVGDTDAALGFFARAEEVAPRDGRTKAGLGSAFTMLRQPSAALRYFGDAVSLGVPVLDIAKDRGLAYDLRGNTRAAQADYKLVLAARPDPEVTRRLALSQAIAGDGKGALATLDPQIRAKDPAAWRVRAFIMAMGGDAAGATRAAQAVMAPNQAQAFAPYFRRMASLKASEKAAAAHFGSFPGDPGTLRMADLLSDGERAARVALEDVGRAAPVPTEAGRPDAGQRALGAEGQVPASTAGSRVALRATPAPATVAPRNPVPAPAPNTRTASVAARPTGGSDLIRIVGTRADVPATLPTTAIASAVVPPEAPVPAPAPVPVPVPRPAPTPAPVATPGPTATTQPTATSPAPGFSAGTTPVSTQAPVATPAPVATQIPVATQAPLATPADAQPATPTATPIASAPPPSPTPAGTPVSAAPPSVTIAPVQGPPATAAGPPPPSQPKVEAAPVATIAAPPPPRPKVEAAPAPAPAPSPPQPKVERVAAVSPPLSRPKVERPASPAPADAQPSAPRHYAQVGIGQDLKALAGDWRRLRARAGTALNGQEGWTAPLGKTNRLLVGPFASAREAQAFVNKLSEAKVDAYVFSAGKDVEMAPVGR